MHAGTFSFSSSTLLYSLILCCTLFSPILFYSILLYSTLLYSTLLYSTLSIHLSFSIEIFTTVLRDSIGEICSEVYEVDALLGRGSYGSVYHATHRLTGDERAVKVMNVDRVTSYYLRKLHTEISILKCVDHPNIIKLQDVFFGTQSVYLVTDLCKGE